MCARHARANQAFSAASRIIGARRPEWLSRSSSSTATRIGSPTAPVVVLTVSRWGGRTSICAREGTEKPRDAPPLPDSAS